MPGQLPSPQTPARPRARAAPPPPPPPPPRRLPLPQVKSIHYKRLPVGLVVAGQTAALALKKVKRHQVGLRHSPLQCLVMAAGSSQPKPQRASTPACRPCRPPPLALPCQQVRKGMVLVDAATAPKASW